MSLRSLLRSFSVRASLALLVLIAAGGCSSAPPPFLFNAEVSVNVAPINPKWPKHFEDLTPAQRVVWNEHGRPEAAHIQWSTTRDVSDAGMVMRNLQNTGKKVGETPFGWIYTRDKIEVVFSDFGLSETRPLSDAIVTIMKYGDPQQVRPVSSKTGKQTEFWTYVNQGVRLKFEDGKLVDTDRGTIPAMPNYLGQ